MPNRLPPCPICQDPRKRHLPENCPEARKISPGAAGGILVIPNGIPALISALRATRAQIDRALKELGAEVAP